MSKQGESYTLVVLPSQGHAGEVTIFRWDHYPAEMSCVRGRSVRETRASGGSGRVVRTPGAYVELVWPESSSVAFVWYKDHFIEVWTSD